MGMSELFKEIGNTLEETAKETLAGGVVSLRQSISRQVSESTYGQAVIGDIKQQELAKMLPVIVLVVIGIFVLGRVIR